MSILAPVSRHPVSLGTACKKEREKTWEKHSQRKPSFTMLLPYFSVLSFALAAPTN